MGLVKRCTAVFITVTTFFVASIVGSQASTTRADLGFPVGWYDQLYSHATFASMQTEGTNTVLPYGMGDGVPTYLNNAANSGTGVFIQLDPALVNVGDVAAITTFVNTYKSYPALRGWYLSDEPTLGQKMSVATGELLYTAIKAADPVHPVAMAFYVTENAQQYANAFDIMMWDYYPSAAGSAEYHDLDVWHNYLAAGSLGWRTTKDFIPIIQAFGTDGTKYTAFRLPTAAEERYMVYTALQVGVDGLMFWAHYASDATWRANVFVPLMTEVNALVPAVKAGPYPGAKSSTRGVGVTLFRDPLTKKFTLIAVRHGSTSTKATITIPSVVRSKRHKATLSFGPYQVKVLHF